MSGLLAYSLKVCMSLMQNKKFRNDVLRVLVKLYMNLEKPDFINVCQVATDCKAIFIQPNCLISSSNIFLKDDAKTLFFSPTL